MKRLFDFCLKGCGQLNFIDENSTQVSIQVSYEACSGHSEKNRSDQIILECQVLVHLKEKLQRIKGRYQNLEGVWVRFRAIYDRFGVCHSGQDCDESLNLLHWRCQLINLVIL